MPDIFLHVEGQQTGPYQPAQVGQLLAEGKISAATPAWYHGLAGWSTVAVVLTAFPPAGGPPPFVPPVAPLPPMPGVPAKKGMSGPVLAVIIIVACFGGIFVLSCLAGIALGPITNGIKKAKENMAMQQARQIDLMMYEYATDHSGTYPDGKTSTEVFQKLIDEKYAADPAVFYVAMPGKTKPTSEKLTADNVCYDVTSGVVTDSPDGLPVVFSTGYTMTYAAGGNATRDPGNQTAFPGMAIAYKSNMAQFKNAFPDGTVFQVIPASFDPGTKTYQQLKP